MEAYIAAVLRDIYLPQIVRKAVETDLQSEFAKASAEGKSPEQLAEQLGAPEKVANQYNDHYRGAMRKKLRGLNFGVLGLVAGIFVFSFVLCNHLYIYAQERVLWYQYQLFSNTTSQGSPRSQQNSDRIAGMASGQSADDPGQEMGDVVFVTSISRSRIIACGLGIVLCGVGIYFVERRKNQWRGYTMYIPPSRAT